MPLTFGQGDELRPSSRALHRRGGDGSVHYRESPTNWLMEEAQPSNNAPKLRL